jgi:hypothetical protein
LKKNIKNKTYGYYDETEKLISDTKENAKSKSVELLKKAERIFSQAKSKTGLMFSSGKKLLIRKF